MMHMLELTYETIATYYFFSTKNTADKLSLLVKSIIVKTIYLKIMVRLWFKSSYK